MDPAPVVINIDLQNLTRAIYFVGGMISCALFLLNMRR